MKLSSEQAREQSIALFFPFESFRFLLELSCRSPWLYEPALSGVTCRSASSVSCAFVHLLSSKTRTSERGFFLLLLLSPISDPLFAFVSSTSTLTSSRPSLSVRSFHLHQPTPPFPGRHLLPFAHPFPAGHVPDERARRPGQRCQLAHRVWDPAEMDQPSDGMDEHRRPLRERRAGRDVL